MATIFRKLSPKADKATGRHEILLRFKQGNKLDQRAKSNVFISIKYWDDNEKVIHIKDRLQTDETTYHVNAKKKLAEIEAHLSEAFLKADKTLLPAGWVQEVIDRHNFPERYEAQDQVPEQTFFGLFDEFLEKRKLSEVRKRNFRVIYRTLQRYELHKGVSLDVDTWSDDTFLDLDKFLRAEYTLVDTPKYKKILKEIPESRTPQPRGQNTINDIFTKLRTFLLWCEGSSKTSNRFKIQIPECVYGTPYYISVEERKQIERTNLSNHKQLAVQRDIFTFQCLIGCRVGDFYQMSRKNIVNGAVEYVPRKTKDGNPVTVSVPLNETAKAILARYADCTGDALFPFISEQKYNVAIKRIFRAARINRIVQWRNPLTGDSEPRPMYEIASSHLARRTFVGNIYKKVKDPNLVGVLSGHKEGSKAFSRYRDIDNDMKRELTSLLE